MKALDEHTWKGVWDSAAKTDGSHTLTVTAETSEGQTAVDRITIVVSQECKYKPPLCLSVDYENALGGWPEKHIPGTQLGPNENGRRWPSRKERGHSTR